MFQPPFVILTAPQPHNVAVGIPNEYTVPTTPWIPSPTPLRVQKKVDRLVVAIVFSEPG